MATQLYALNRPAPYTPATIRGAWDQTAGHITRALDHVKIGGGVFNFVRISETAAAANHNVLMGRWVSGPLAAQTIDGTVDVVLSIRELQSDADLAWHLHIYVTQGDTDVVRGTLLDNHVETIANEWPTSTLGRALAAAQTMASLAVSSGDHIVIEIGYVALNATSASRGGDLGYGTQLSHPNNTLHYGEDLTVGSPNWDTEAGFFTFSDDILFDVEGRISHIAAEASEDGDGDFAIGFLSHVHGEASEDGDFDIALGFLTHVTGEVMMDNTIIIIPPAVGLGTAGARPRRRGKRILAPAAVGWLPMMEPPIPPGPLIYTRPPVIPERRIIVLEATVLPLLPTAPLGVCGPGPGWQYTHFADSWVFTDNEDDHA